MKRFLLFSIAAILAGCSLARKTNQVQEARDPAVLYRQAMTLYEQGEYRKALPYFKKLLYGMGINDYTDEAQYYLAATYYQLKDYDLAILELEFFIKNFRFSELYPDALLLLAKAYEGKYSNIHLDISPLKKGLKYAMRAKEILKGTDKEKEADAVIKSIREKFARKHLLAAWVYNKLKKHRAELLYLELYLKEYPDMDNVDSVRARVEELREMVKDEEDSGNRR